MEPLLAGAFAGRADLLSARSTVPDIEVLARRSRSLYLGMRRRQRHLPASPVSGPGMVTLRGGLSGLVDSLVGVLSDCEVRLGSPVTGLERAGGGYRLSQVDGECIDTDVVVLAIPAFGAAGLLEVLLPHAAGALREIPYTDVASITLAYPREALTRPLDETGFLVPPAPGRLLVGCSWLNAKWGYRPDGQEVLLRCLVGGYGDPAWSLCDDSDLVARIHRELVEIMGLAAPPRDWHVQRWPRALPQYTVGHRARLDRVASELRRLPGVHVTGAAYEGAGLASCIAQGERTALVIAAQLASAAVGGLS